MQLTLHVHGFPPFPQVLTALPAPVSVLLLTLLLMLCVIPVIATAQRPQEIQERESPQKPPWRVINDAPYRVVPAYPPLKKTGETPEELGFESIDALLSSIENRSAFRSVTFSPDGHLLATGANDRTVKLWDVQARTLLHTFEGHAGSVWSVAFSPDGRLLATGADDQTVKLWDVQARTLLHTFEGHAGLVSSVAFSPDGRLLATGANDRTVKLWDVQARTLLHTFEGHAGLVSSVTFSPDGHLLATEANNRTVKLWDVQARTLLHTLEGYTSGVWSVAFSPDGRLLATEANDQTVKLWDVQARTLLHTFEGHAGLVLSVAFSPDGRLLATGANDRTVKLWDVQARTLLHTLEGYTSGVWSVTFSPDGRLLATGANDRTVKLWDVQARTLLHTFEGHAGLVLSVAFSPDGRLLATGANDRTVKLWDVQARTLLHTLEGHAHGVRSVAFWPDGRLLATGANDRMILHTLEGYTNWVSSVAFSPDGRLLATGAYDRTVKLWDVQARTLLHTFEGHADGVSSVAFSPDGRLLATGAYDQTVKLWDVQARTLLHTFEGHPGLVLSVAFSPDGRLLATGANDRTVKLWDVQARTLLHTFEGYTSGIRSVAFSPDGHLLATGANNRTVKLWDVQARTLLHTFEGHADGVSSVAFSPDGRLLATGAYDRTVKLWDVQARTLLHLLHTFEGHADGVSSVAFSPDGRLLATGAYDRTVKLWDVQKRSELQTLLGGSRGNWLRVDSRRRVFRGDDGTLLKKRVTQHDNWQPVPMADTRGQDAFSIAMLPESITIQPGESPEVRIQVTNTGTAPAYWLHVQPATSDDGAIRLIPPNRLFTEKGPQAWKHERLARLEPGESAMLDARVAVNLTLPAAFLDSGMRPLELTVVSASGTEVRQTIRVNVQSPRLAWQTAQLEGDGKTLKIGLFNTGTVALRDFTLELYARGVDKPLSQQSIAELQPAAPLAVAAVLPDGIDLKSQPLRLQGRTRALPIFSWDLLAPDIQTASHMLLWLLAPLLLLTLVALFYLRRYHHPLVLQLSGDPALLLHLLPEQLQEAHTRLEQTRRLDTVLSQTEVTRNTLDESIAFFGHTTPEAKAQWLARRIGGVVSPLPRAESQGERVRLWELRLPEAFPLNLDRCLLGFPAADSNPQDFLDDLRTIPQTRLRVSLLISPSSDYQRQLYDKTKDRTNKWVAPSRAELTNLLLSPTPEMTLANLLASQLTLTQLSPYQLGGGVNREAIFFGRQEIIAHIMNRDPANYLIVSGRQLGKSSLLKALERRYAEQPDVACFYLALSSEVLVPRLASALGLSNRAGLEEIAAYVANMDRRCLFLIDEADKFVRHELENAYRTLEALRRMSEEGHCNFILAGFWELYEQAVLDYRSPLKNFAEIIQLGALEADACRELALKPMQTMRLEYTDAALVEQLLDATGQRANLMAIACHEILTQLRPDERVITEADVHRSLHSEAIFNALKGWDAMTDDQEACQWDRIVVYATIDKAPFDFAALVALLHQHGVAPDGSAIEHSLARLELGFVLGRDDQRRYFYRVPLFRELILQDSPQAKLKVEVDSWRASQIKSKSPAESRD